MARTVTARAPGRVNLIGEHTDYNEGLALPVAIDRATTVRFTADRSDRLRLHSDQFDGSAEVSLDPLPDISEIAGMEPAWARIAAGLVLALAEDRDGDAAPGDDHPPGTTGSYPMGGTVRIESNLPAEVGLSSSAALCVALARALGADGDPIAIAALCQQAEAAAGSAVGLMDPLVSVAGQRGHALLVDFSTVRWEPVAIDGTELLVVHSGVTRRLADSPYRERRAECAAAARKIGIPLGRVTMADVASLRDPTLRRRARHVVTECARVRTVARLLHDGDPVGAGRVLSDSHRSQAGDFAASTPVVDQLVQLLVATPGVHGARMTGGGFGGCVVALADPGAVDLARFGGRALRVEPSDGATVTVTP